MFYKAFYALNYILARQNFKSFKVLLSFTKKFLSNIFGATGAKMQFFDFLVTPKTKSYILILYFMSVDKIDTSSPG